MTTVLKSFYNNCKSGLCNNWSVSSTISTETSAEGINSLVITALFNAPYDVTKGKFSTMLLIDSAEGKETE
jgi:hypothetical protein